MAYRREAVEAAAVLGWERARDQLVGVEFTLKQLVGAAWGDLTAVEQRNAGRRFREKLRAEPIGNLDDWKTSDNEWHYRRR